ncbi:MAG: hypothetical protein WB495_07465 [Xanthobacteraceae bacterium]
MARRPAIISGRRPVTTPGRARPASPCKAALASPTAGGNWRTWNGCPPGYTVQGGECRAYRGY